MAQSYHCVKWDVWLSAIMQERKPQDQDKFVIRLPEGMRERIKAVAERNNRSMNAEIIFALSDWLETDKYHSSLVESDSREQEVDVVFRRIRNIEDIERTVTEIANETANRIRSAMLAAINDDESN